MLRWVVGWRSRIYSKCPSMRNVRLASTKSDRDVSSSRLPRLLPKLIAPTLKEPPFTKATRISIYLVSLGLAGHIFVTYFYSLEPAYGISMLPTIASFGDWVLISKYYRRGRGVNVGDVVSFKHPVREGEFAIKRIIGMEGDFVLMNTPGKSDTVMQVPQGHCWVVGDNLEHSRDSRMFGPLPMALLHGKVIAKVNNMPYLPLPKLDWIEHGLRPGYVDDDVD